MEIAQLMLYLSIILVVGFVFGKLAELAKIPDITGYIVAGVLLGLLGSKVFNLDITKISSDLSIISKVVLGIVAFMVGTALWFPKLKKVGKQIVIITALESTVTMIVVFFSVWLLSKELWIALILSAIASTTAPTAIMAITKRLKTKGPLTDTVLPVVGIDNMIGLIVFGIFSSIAVSIINVEEVSFVSAVLIPFRKIGISIATGLGIGAIFGLIDKFIIGRFKVNDRSTIYLTFILAFIFVSIWLEGQLYLSLIIIVLVSGMTFTNLVGKEPYKIQNTAINNFSGVFLILFFTLAGLQLQLDVLVSAGVLAIFYVVFRIAGKMGGGYLGSVLAKSTSPVKKNIGMSLLAQGGVEIGMLLTLKEVLPNISVSILGITETPFIIVNNIVLAGILVFELIGPVGYKFSIAKAGEITLFESVEIEELIEGQTSNHL